MTKEEMKEIFGRDDMVYTTRVVNGITVGVYLPPSEVSSTQKRRRKNAKGSSSLGNEEPK